MRVTPAALQRVEHGMHRPQQGKGSVCPGRNNAFANAKGGRQPDDCYKYSHRPHCQSAKTMLSLRDECGKCGKFRQIQHNAPGGDTQQNGCRGRQLQQGIDPRHFLCREVFRYGSVKGGAENCGLQAHQKNHRHHARPVHIRERPHAIEHGRQFHKLGPDDHFILGHAVCQPPCPGRAGYKRQGEHGGGNALDGFKPRTGGKQQSGLFKKIVVECAHGIGRAHAQQDFFSIGCRE